MTPVPPAQPPVLPPDLRNVLPSPEHVLVTSVPRPRLPVYHLAAVSLAATLAGMLFSGNTADAAGVIRKIVPLIVPLGVVAFSLCWGAHLAAEMRAEERAVDTAEDALRAQRLDVAVHVVSAVTASAMQSPANRLRALGIYVRALLDLRRYDDVVKASGQMLAEGVPAAMAGPLWSAMAYSLLREDRFVDAGRAIHELKKLSRSTPDGVAAALLAVVEMYRDAVSGHPDEVLEAHAKYRDAIAAALGHRVSEADALAALSAHLRKRSDLAASLWHRATLLQSAKELVDRYPELRVMTAYERAPLLADVTRGAA